MEPLLGRTTSRDNLGEGGRHSMLSALPPPPVPLGVPFFNQPPLSNSPYGHLAPLPRKPETPPLAPLPPPPRQQPLDITRTPLDTIRAPSPLQQLEPVRAPSPMQQQADAPRRTVQTYRKRQHDVSEPRPFDFGANHVPGMLAHPDGEIANLPPRSGTGVRLRPARLPPCCCIPPPQPEPLVPVDPMLLQVLRMHDQRRMINPGQVANVVVYDCIEQPPRSSFEPALSAHTTTPATAGAGGEAGVGVGAGTGTAGLDGQGGGGGGGTEAGKRASSASGAGGVHSGGRLSTESGGQGRGGEGEGPQPRGSSGSGVGCGGGGGSSDAAAADASTRGDAGPPSCSYSRAGTYDYFEDMPAWYTPRGPADHTLVFESRYESGNLRRAIQVYPYEYDLILRPDINTRGHTQWFFFSVANTRAGCRYKFNIINLLKEDSLYNDGMQPLIHSAKAQAGRGLGWHRAGTRIWYYGNSIRRGRSGKTYFTLTFTLTAEYDNDVLHMAHCYPYTYTDLQRYIRSLELDPLRRHQLRRETLATSLAGNPVDLLTITSPTDDQDALKRRKAVVVSARVHPGESNASWMMKGVLDFLTGPSLDARILRDTFVFKVIPMLNPDGVITGNYRCSLAGVDLNRVWNDPSRKLHPVIHATKLFLKQLVEEREVALFCDLHGHSRKRGVFMYGCEKKLPRDSTPFFPGWPLPGSAGGQANIQHRFQEKLLPLLVQYNAPDIFSYQNCSFKVQKSKGGTSRVVGFRELGLVNSFTVEASFAGPVAGRWARQHFTTSHLEQQGAAIMSALLDYWDPEAYGYGDLLGQLDFLHPSNGEAPPRFITTPDGQMVEVEDDEPPTDSDDESSDDGGRAATGRSRTAGRAGQGPGFMQQYYNAYGMSPGAATAHGGSGGAVGGALLSDLAGGPGAGGQSAGDKGHSDSEVVMDPKKARRRARLAMQKALLRAEQAKATEGLAACLPMMAALQLQSPTGADGRGTEGRGLGGEGDPDGGGCAAGEGAAGAPGGGPRANNGSRALTSPATPHAIEYAKQRGVYRGDAPQWTVPGLNAAYDMPESAASSPTSPAPLPPRPPSPSRAITGRLANTTNAFNVLLLAQTNHAMAAAAGGGGGGAGAGSPLGSSASANGAHPFSVGAAGGLGASLSFGGGFGSGGSFSGSYGRPVSPGRPLTNGGHRGPFSPLPMRPSPYALGAFGGGGALSVNLGPGAPLSASGPAAPGPPLQATSPSGVREDTAGSSQSYGAPGIGEGPAVAAGYGRPLYTLPVSARSSASRPLSSRASADLVPSAAAGGGVLRPPPRPPQLPQGEPLGGGAAIGLVPGAGGAGGDDGHEEGHTLQAIAAAYSDPEKLRRDREALEQRVTEAVLTTSPLFQRQY